MLTCLHRTIDTFAFPVCVDLLFTAANSAASVTVSRGGPSSPVYLITTCDPGHPAACIHQSLLSLHSGLQLTSSLSELVRPTRMSTPSADVKVQYGFRGPALACFCFTFFTRCGRGGGASFTPSADASG